MEEAKHPNIFLFTSFQGGIGKSSIALRFAEALQKKTRRQGVFFEINMLSPSYLVEEVQSQGKLKNGLIDYFITDWVGFKPDSMQDFFTLKDDLFLIPFTGIHPQESLVPRFPFNENDLGPAVERLFSIIAKRNMFAVIDLPLCFTPFPQFLLNSADILFYIYQSREPSPAFAKRFLFEAGRNPQLKDRVCLLRNLVDPQCDDAEGKLQEREFILPVEEDESPEGDSPLDRAIRDLVGNAVEFPVPPKVPPPLPEDAAAETTDPVKEYVKTMRTEIIANLEKRFGLSDIELRRRVEQNIEHSFQRNPPPAVPGADPRPEIKKYLIDEILGLGPLEEFMRDPEVTEIMVNGPSRIFVEKRGKLIHTGRTFNNADHVRTVIDRILMPVGRMVNERTPYVDARLIDGSRVHAIIPPLSLTGPMLTIRRFSRVPFGMDDLVFRFKTLTPQVSDFLRMSVRLKKNIIVSGGASSGKTTLLNVLSTFINPEERVILIEDSAELKLAQENMGRLEARQQGTEAKTQVTIRDLVRNALRMRPDRIIVGESRGEEALDMLQAMNTGHDGSLTTLHANSPRDALSRLETMVLMAGVELPLKAIRDQIASSVNLIIQTGRLADGNRKILEVAEVVGIEDSMVKTESVYKFQKRWIDEEGRVYGEIVPSGYVPTFFRNVPGHLEEMARNLFVSDKQTS